MKVKKFLAIAAAALTMSCVPFNAYADTLAERDGLKYLVSDSGTESLYSGWTKKGGDRYYYKNGVMKKNCWITSKGVRKYFLQADGKAATGKVTIQGVEYEFDGNGVLVPDAWGLTLTVKDVTPTSCTAVFTQSGGNPTGELVTGVYFELEQYKNGKWEALEMLPQEHTIGWVDVGFPIDKNSSREVKNGWQELYGELPAGKYRIGKDVDDWRAPGDSDTKMYYAYFEIAKVTVKDAEYEFDENGVLVPDAWGLTLTAKDVTLSGCTVVFVQSGGNPTGELQTGSYYSLERYENGKWETVEMLPQEYDVAWPAISYPIFKNDSSEFNVEWQSLYGELSAGKYRVGKEVLDFRKAADYDRKMYYAYFEIKG